MPADPDLPVAATRVDTIDTPCVVVDLDVVDRNIGRLQEYLSEHGIANRPHIKTHKLPLLAHWQVAAGARGITVQSVGEAEVMAAAGLDDILITYNVMGADKVRRLAQVAQLARVRVALDNEVALEAVAAAALLAERKIGVLIEFESGKLRQGVVTPEEAALLAKVAAERPYLEFLGLLTYPNADAVPTFVTRTRELLGEAGLELKVVSVGGTPLMWSTHVAGVATELRAGTYIYNDRNSMAAGAAALEDCALHVHVTLVSKPTANRGVIDAGSKTLTSDLFRAQGGGYGLILEYPEAKITELSEEHGAVDFSECSRTPAIGERLRVVPNHVCPVSNLHDEVYAHRGGVLVATLPVAARGKTR